MSTLARIESPSHDLGPSAGQGDATLPDRDPARPPVRPPIWPATMLLTGALLSSAWVFVLVWMAYRGVRHLLGVA